MKHMDVHELKRAMDAATAGASQAAAALPFQLVDVREDQEWAHCRLPGAVLIPLSRFTSSAADQLSRESPIILYCHHGMRSMHAAQYLEAQGFHDVTNLTGGIDAWSKCIDPQVPTY
jgi:rhodanese-related sulfurtransferase